MRTLSFNSCLLLLAFTSCNSDQVQDVPQEIKSSFEQNYPTAEDTEWSIKPKSYEVNFSDEGQPMEAEINLDGTLKEEEKIITKHELPTAAVNYIDKNYPLYYLEEASMEIEGDQTLYEVELLNGFFREIELAFDLEGNLVGEEIFDNDQ